jgi:antitoxin HicB
MTIKDLDYYLALPYTITLTELDPGEGGWFARVEELPGCMSDGETPEEAREMIREAMELWLEVRIEKGYPIPEPGEAHE